MSDSIIVRVTLDSYDVVHPSEKQTQVYVQIPEVGRASWLLDADFYGRLKNEPWPHVIDSAHEEYERRRVVSDSTSEAARKAIVDWLLLSEGADYDERYDVVQAAWEADQARQHPVARKLLAENERLRSRVGELEAAAYGDAKVRLLDPVEQIRHLHACVDAQLARANTLDRLCREQRARADAATESPFAWAEKLDAKSLDNFLTVLGSATEYEPMDGALARVNEVIASFRVAVEAQAARRAEDEADGLTRLLAPSQALREGEPPVKCRCGESDADPYACEAEDCTHEFSELSPFSGGPVEGHDAKVSRTCGCGWRTSVWHVDDGSAEEELHGHVVRVHGGVYPKAGGS